jgi:hypothetical protein
MLHTTPSIRMLELGYLVEKGLSVLPASPQLAWDTPDELARWYSGALHPGMDAFSGFGGATT